eukprot:Opistho-2@85419
MYDRQASQMASSMSVKLPAISSSGKGQGSGEYNGTFVPKAYQNMTPYKLKRMTPIERSKYLAYQPPETTIAEAVAASSRRVAQQANATEKARCEALVRKQKQKDLDRQTGLFGAQLAKERVQMTRHLAGELASCELEQLIASQPTSLKAVKLQILVPPRPKEIALSKLVSEKERLRIQDLLERDAEQ